MEPEPKVSIILPTYNGSRFITQAITSVFQQSFNNWELIIVNDGSTDDTEKIITAWLKKDNRVRYIKHAKNKGPSSARNTGLRYALGEFIAFLDDDDIWLPKKIEIQLNELENQKADLIFSNWYIWIGENEIKKAFYSNPIYTSKIDLFRLLLKNNFGSPSTAMARRASLMKVGQFDENLKSSEDYDLWLRFALNGMKIAFCSQPLIYYRIHSQQASKNIYALRASRLMVFRKFAKNKLLLFKYPLLATKIVKLQVYKFVKDLFQAINHIMLLFF